VPGQLAHVRISVGSAVYPDDGRALETLLATADRRMYGDKTAQKRGAARWIELAEHAQREAARTILRD
jgi:predicted signal transduction protein with EAL and GGDEF domain